MSFFHLYNSQIAEKSPSSIRDISQYQKRLQRYNLPCLKHVSLILMRLQRYNTPLPKQESLILTMKKKRELVINRKKVHGEDGVLFCVYRN
ncbi:unnamed protein product [Ranitomeya imitator]|uniref:Uncharacterized protein n=1 Tax=Ranitomeya imitator TaxID=111125 RepID=A0ABN9KVD1_9NEOB|nr:unnamed protein product [Ranitomeya imitator]